MNIIYISAECFPYTSISNGLSHLVFSLSREVEKQGHNVKIFLPRYGSIDVSNFLIEKLPSDFHVSFDSQNIQFAVYKGILPDSLVSVFLLDSQNYFATSKEIYLGGEEDIKRFNFFSRAVWVVISKLGLEIDLIHAFNPHTAFCIPGSLKKASSFFTLYNMPEKTDRFYDMTRKAISSSFVTCVSGKNVKDNFELVECGIDKALYNPESGTEIVQNYSKGYFSLGKRKCKEDLLELLELENDVHIPIFMVVLQSDENLDVLISSLKELLHFNLSLLLFGEPDSLYKQELQRLMTEYKNLRLLNSNDHSLLKKIYAGSDFLLLINEKETSAIPVLIGARYGTVPVAYINTGAGSINDVDLTSHANGILFEEPTEEGLLTAVKRALTCYRDNQLWTKLVKEVMNLDYDIAETSKKYLDLYKHIMEKSHFPKTVAAE